MRYLLEQLLRTAEVLSAERAQLRWDEYRHGAGSADPEKKRASETAYATLLASFGSLIYRHIWGFLRSDLAEDVFQDVLKRWHEERLNPRLADVAAVLPWLRAVAANKCREQFRRAARRRSRETRCARPEEAPPTEHPDETQEMIRVALAKLNEKQREAVALHFFEGLDQQTAAQVMRLDRHTFATLLKQALARLETLLPTLTVGAAVGLPTALSASPPPLTASRLGELAARAWAQATTSGWRLGQIAMILVGLAGLGGATWAVWERHEPESAPVVTTVAGMGGTPTALVEEETLQAKNVRLTRRDVVPLILPELQKFLPPDNDVKLVDVRAFGSKVECEFHAVKPVFGEPARLKIRYCVLRRWLELEADALGAGGFQRLSPDRPIFLELELPFLPRKELILGREQTDAVRRAFGRLPGDERAERESIAFWFGSPRPPEGRLFLPTGARAIAGNSRDLFFHAADEGLYVLRDGSWRYAGYCPGWLAEVDETRLYRIDKGWIHSRPIEPRNEPWAPLCPLPLLPPKQQPSVLSQMRAGPGLLFVSSHERVLWVRSLAEPDARWVSEPWPGGADAGLFAGVGKRLVAVRDWSLIVWPVGGRDWVPVGPIPFARPVVQTGVLGMTAWRGRVLVWPSGGGPIFARTLDPEAKWQVIGHFGPLEAHPLPTTPRNKHGGVEKGQ